MSSVQSSIRPLAPQGPSDRVGTSLPYAKTVTAWLWIIIASGWFVMVEPAPYDILMVGLGGLLLATGLRVPSELGSVLSLMALFILANIVSIVVARDSTVQPFGVMSFYTALTVYLLFSYVLIASVIVAAGGRIINVIWSAWILAATIAALSAVLSYFGAIPGAEVFVDFGRAKGAFKDPNVFGPFLIPAALVLLTRLKQPGIGRRLLIFFALIILVVGLFLSFSRGAWGNFLLSVGVFAVLQAAAMRSLRQYMGLAFAAIFVSLVLVSVLVVAQGQPEVREMLGKRLSLTQSYDVETGGRFWVQRKALGVAVELPLGVGPNRTETHFGMNPHNVYIKTFVENGWLGGIAFLSMIVMVLLHGLRSATRDWPFRDSAIVVLASLVGIAAESIIIDTLHWRHFFVLLGMMSGLTILARHHRQPYRLSTQRLPKQIGSPHGTAKMAR